MLAPGPNLRRRESPDRMFAAIVFTAAVNTGTDHSKSGEEPSPMMTPAGPARASAASVVEGHPDAAAMVLSARREGSTVQLWNQSSHGSADTDDSRFAIGMR